MNMPGTITSSSSNSAARMNQFQAPSETIQPHMAISGQAATMGVAW